jgi:coatomer subunit beta'
MDSAGKVVYARNSEIVTTNLQGAVAGDEEISDGQKIISAVRDMGTTEIYAQSLQHSPNGR